MGHTKHTTHHTPHTRARALAVLKLPIEAVRADGSKALAAALCEFLFGSTENGGCGFSGDKTSYYDVDNWYVGSGRWGLS